MRSLCHALLLAAAFLPVISAGQGVHFSYSAAVVINYDTSDGRGPVPLPFGGSPYPEYPAQFVRAGLTGNVEFELTLRSDGSVESTRITKSHFEELSLSVASALGQWRFEADPVGVKPKSLRKIRGTVRFEVRPDDR